jgi:hypothetical protein
MAASAVLAWLAKDGFNLILIHGMVPDMRLSGLWVDKEA